MAVASYYRHTCAFLVSGVERSRGGVGRRAGAGVGHSAEARKQRLGGQKGCGLCPCLGLDLQIDSRGVVFVVDADCEAHVCAC